MAETLYRIVDTFDYLDREDAYTGLTLAEAGRRMDDLIGCGEAVILEDWAEPCERCDGKGSYPNAYTGCGACHGDGKWPGPWCHTDSETGREVTMRREESPPTERTAP